MKRGELRWSSPTLSGAERKRRPFLIVSDDAFNTNERYPKVMVVHLTSVKRLGGPYDWEVHVPRGIARLPRASIIQCAEIYTLLKEQLGGVIGTLPRDYLEKVERALAVALSIRRDQP